MRLRTQRLELAFQFVFLIDSSGPAAAEETASMLEMQVADRQSAIRRQVEEWCAAPAKNPEGVHGDSLAALAALRERFGEALYAAVGAMLQFEADRPSVPNAAPRTDGAELESWRPEVHAVFSRAVRDHLTIPAARQAMIPLFETIDLVFADARTAVVEASAMAHDAMSRATDTDRVTLQLAPTWPAHRQAATDRAILRLGRSEMLAGRTPPKWVVHHCVNLAKRYSTEKSPAFVNALLDKILKQVTADQGAAPAEEGPETQAPRHN
ncbi:MAG: hypothetical protein L6Q35_01565 [Phycisphaerales bacterium]|nr:hypothetical protein [Phycisphaerales bacterium]